MHHSTAQHLHSVRPTSSSSLRFLLFQNLGLFPFIGLCNPILAPPSLFDSASSSSPDVFPSLKGEGRFRGLIPDSAKIVRRVFQPGVSKRAKASALACVRARRASRASSSYEKKTISQCNSSELIPLTLPNMPSVRKKHKRWKSDTAFVISASFGL
jgi:hypothetical protein